MEKEELVGLLEDGWSLERIGQRYGKHASTVAYWVKRHGLRAAHRDKYAPKGGLRREQLTALVAAELTLREIADRLGVGTATVRHWLAKYDLRTAAAARRDSRDRRSPPPRRVTRRCRTHGVTTFVLEGRGYYRCMRCRVEQVSKRRRRVKRILVAEAGGQCAVCGYDRHPAALEFHHLDPASKSFNLSLRGVTRRIDELRAEARKCVLLCATCHAEVEAGVVNVPDETAGREKGRQLAA
jgi:transposase